MANINDAAAQIVSADGSISRLYQSLQADGEEGSDRVAWAILALAESNLAIARAIQEHD